jgi:hypothetical protein
MMIRVGRNERAREVIPGKNKKYFSEEKIKKIRKFYLSTPKRYLMGRELEGYNSMYNPRGIGDCSNSF